MVMLPDGLVHNEGMVMLPDGLVHNEGMVMLPDGLVHNEDYWDVHTNRSIHDIS